MLRRDTAPTHRARLLPAMPHLDDWRETALRVARGDREALDAVLTRHLDGLRAWVRLRMGALLSAREESIDVVQSACREVVVDLPDGPGLTETEFRRRLYQAAERKLVDKARHHRAARRDVARDAAPDAGDLESLMLSYASLATPSRIAAARETFQRIEAAFARLSEDHREVILLARVVGMPHADIARHLGREEGAVRMLLSRALSRLATLADVER
jgi:RNA polymerase sigma-70 factor (ECF subfamily)